MVFSIHDAKMIGHSQKNKCHTPFTKDLNVRPETSKTPRRKHRN